jgi:hypothetical protein
MIDPAGIFVLGFLGVCFIVLLWIFYTGATDVPKNIINGDLVCPDCGSKTFKVYISQGGDERAYIIVNCSGCNKEGCSFIDPFFRWRDT